MTYKLVKQLVTLTLQCYNCNATVHNWDATVHNCNATLLQLQCYNCTATLLQMLFYSCATIAMLHYYNSLFYLWYSSKYLI